MIWSLGWRPRLILPRDLWKALDERQRSTLVVHELAHLRRGDHFLRFFELFVTALFWWHPLVWWVRHALRDAEEQCCDAWVVWAFPDAARSYAETLLETIDFLNHSKGAEPLLASGFGKVHHLRRRLTMILSETTPRLLGIRGALGLLGLAALLLPVNATWAQKPEKPEQVEVVVESAGDLTYSPQTVNVIGSDVDLTLDEGKPQIVEDGKRRVRMVLQANDSPEIRIVGSLDEAMFQLKKQIAEIAKKSSPSDADQKLLRGLEQAIQELAKVKGQIKEADLRAVKVGEKKDEKRVMIVRRRTRIALTKPLTDEQKAEVKKLRVRAKTLSGELEAKAKELAEAHARLAKLEGGPQGKSTVLFRPKQDLVAVPQYTTVRQIQKKDRKDEFLIESDVTLHTDQKASKPVQVKKVEPTKRRVEITIGSDDGLAPGHILELVKPNIAKVVKPKSLGDFTIETDHTPARSEQQRIEELEKTLKKLVQEVDRLKKERDEARAAK